LIPCGRNEVGTLLAQPLDLVVRTSSLSLSLQLLLRKKIVLRILTLYSMLMLTVQRLETSDKPVLRPISPITLALQRSSSDVYTTLSCTSRRMFAYPQSAHTPLALFLTASILQRRTLDPAITVSSTRQPDLYDSARDICNRSLTNACLAQQSIDDVPGLHLPRLKTS
jgi:hypothetical protein